MNKQKLSKKLEDLRSLNNIEMNEENLIRKLFQNDTCDEYGWPNSFAFFKSFKRNHYLVKKSSSLLSLILLPRC